MKRMQRSKFHGFDEKRYWRPLDNEVEVKLVAKMLREITHLKPPRGRMGRHLPFDEHFAIEVLAGENWTQGKFSVKDELENLENKGSTFYTKKYEYLSDPADNFSKDLSRLEELHILHQAKLRVQNTVGSLSDLIQGLMGLGLTDIRYDKNRYESTYTATMKLNNFIITVKEVNSDDN